MKQKCYLCHIAIETEEVEELLAVHLGAVHVVDHHHGVAVAQLVAHLWGGLQTHHVVAPTVAVVPAVRRVAPGAATSEALVVEVGRSTAALWGSLHAC